MAGRLLADAFDPGQGFGLAVMADFHYAGADEGCGAYRRRHRKSDVAICSRHVGMESPQARFDRDSDNAQQQAHGKR